MGAVFSPPFNWGSTPPSALRIGGPEGRARLTRGALAISFVIAVGQAVLLARWMGRLPGPPQVVAFLPLVATLVGGFALTLIAVGAIERWGVGSGFAVMLGAGMALELLPRLVSAGQRFDAGQGTLGGLVLWVALWGALAVGTVYLLRRGSRLAAGIPLPACGLVPLTLAATVIMSFVTILTFWTDPRLRTIAVSLEPGASAYAVTVTGLIVLLGVPLAFLFNRPLRDRSWLPVLVSVGFVLGAELLSVLAIYWTHYPPLGVASVVLLAALGSDLAAELSARRRIPDARVVWPLHRLWEVEPALAALSGKEIPAHARSLGFRTLLQFFGPHVPVAVMVPAGRAAEAEAILRARRP